MSTDRNNRLAVLAEEIREAHDVCRASTAAERAVETGRLLIEAKSALPHGAWLPWLREHVGISERLAQGYMRLTRLGLKSATIADLGIRATLARAARRKMPLPGEDEIVVGLAGRPSADFKHEHMLFLWPV